MLINGVNFPEWTIDIAPTYKVMSYNSASNTYYLFTSNELIFVITLDTGYRAITNSTTASLYRFVDGTSTNWEPINATSITSGGNNTYIDSTDSPFWANHDIYIATFDEESDKIERGETIVFNMWIQRNGIWLPRFPDEFIVIGEQNYYTIIYVNNEYGVFISKSTLAYCKKELMIGSALERINADCIVTTQSGKYTLLVLRNNKWVVDATNEDDIYYIPVGTYAGGYFEIIYSNYDIMHASSINDESCAVISDELWMKKSNEYPDIPNVILEAYPFISIHLRDLLSSGTYFAHYTLATKKEQVYVPKELSGLEYDIISNIDENDYLYLLYAEDAYGASEWTLPVQSSNVIVGKKNLDGTYTLIYSNHDIKIAIAVSDDGTISPGDEIYFLGDSIILRYSVPASWIKSIADIARKYKNNNTKYDTDEMLNILNEMSEVSNGIPSAEGVEF